MGEGGGRRGRRGGGEGGGGGEERRRGRGGEEEGRRGGGEEEGGGGGRGRGGGGGGEEEEEESQNGVYGMHIPSRRSIYMQTDVTLQTCCLPFTYIGKVGCIGHEYPEKVLVRVAVIEVVEM